MRAYLLDSSLLSRYPEVLSKTPSATQFITHVSVLAELEQLSQKKAIHPELIAAVRKGAFVDNTDFSYLQSSTKKPGSSASEVESLVELANLKKDGYESVAIVTDRSDVVAIAKNSGLTALESREFLRTISSSGTANPEIAKLVHELSKANQRQLMVVVIVAVALVVIYPFIHRGVRISEFM